MIRSCLVLVVVGCGSSPSHDGPADAATADAPPLDAPSGDAKSEADAAAPDAMLPDPCPHRTVGRGLPQHAYAPSEIFPTSLTIRTPADLAVLDGIKMIAGDLTIMGVAGSVTLPALEVVTGALRALAGETTELHLPRLETVGHDMLVQRGAEHEALAFVEAPRLESVRSLGLYLDQGNLACLVSAELALQIIGAQGPVFALPKLVTTARAQFLALAANALELPALQHGSLAIEIAARTTVHAGAPDQLSLAGQVEALTLSSTSNLTELSVHDAQLHDLDFLAGARHLATVSLTNVSSLTSIAGVAMAPIESLFIRQAPALTDLSALAHAPLGTALSIVQTGATQLALLGATTIATTLEITENPALTSLTMPNLLQLDGFGPLTIANNATLPTCQATAIRDRVIVVNTDAALQISGNLSDACGAL